MRNYNQNYETKLTHKMSQVLSYRFSYLGKYYKDENNEAEANHIDNTKTETNQLPTKLLCFDAMPRHLQFNPFVYTGYRPQMNAWECIVSLTYLHNETINILSHGRCNYRITDYDITIPISVTVNL